MIYYKKKLFNNIAEIWYNSNEIPDKKVDVLRYKFVENVKKNNFSLEELYTILIDLNSNEDILFSNLRKNTRYEINRAINKDNINCETLLDINNTDLSGINKFIDYYNNFAISKERSKIDYEELEKFIITKNICIRYAISNNNILTMHSYIISDNTARLNQSCSLFRNLSSIEDKNLIARANRLLHWDDILYFKNLGLSLYDLGGWYNGKTNTEQLLINKFKESFGGTIKREYSYIVPVSFFGFISVLLHSILNYFKMIKKYFNIN